ncbi:MAG: GGDEF domain-containing protein [Lachnospiraceae bacterium]|nr:GGDEF domain-containing protein [Lachnospiraceae bacterium]
MEPLFSPDIHVLYEHSSIPLGIFYDDGERFHAYLVSEGACKMYESTADEMMTRLNSDDPFVNIVEREEMLKAVRDFSRDDAHYNVVFHEYVGKNRKLITIHGIGEHEYTKDGRRYSIIRYDEISDRSRRFLFRDEEKEIEERDRLFAEIDDAIARSYTSVIYVDTDTQIVTSVRLNRHGKPLEEECRRDPHLRQVIDVYVNALVYRDDMEGVLKLGDYDYVINALEKNNPLYHTYRTVRDGRIVFYRLKIIPFEGGKKLIYGFEYFDDQIREKLALKNQYETQMTLLAGLSCEYETVWLVDATLHHCKLIRSNIKNHIVDIMNRDKEGLYETILGNYIERYVVPEDRERVYSMGDIGNLMRCTKEDEIYHINYYRVDPEGERNYIQLCIARVTDENGVVRFVCGFRNIDSIMEEEKTKNLLFSMAHIDNMTNVNNRRTFDEYMDSNENKEVPDDLVFFSFDLNNLKETNDNYGHEAGDELIIAAATCMREVLGSYGSIYRTGGDEFAAIINVPGSERAALIGKLREKFEKWKGNSSSVLSISMGYVTAGENPGMALHDMRREAEKRMYAQKSDYYMQEGNDRRRGRGIKGN